MNIKNVTVYIYNIYIYTEISKNLILIILAYLFNN